MNTIDLERLTLIFKLSPYQSYIIETNPFKYDLKGLRKKGPVLFAPYKNEICKNFRESIEKFLKGPKFDVIGEDRILHEGCRGVKILPAGYFKIDGQYLDYNGNIISR